jgi:hypothetical protein
MLNKLLVILAFCFGVTNIDAQKYYLGESIEIKSNEFKLIGISSKTGVSNYRYIKPIFDKMFEREIGDIIIGVKDGHIASTIYNLVPLPNDLGVPNSIIDLIQANLPYPMKNINGTWGINIDNNTISFMRANNAITFGKDRIVFNSSVKYSLLINK